MVKKQGKKKPAASKEAENPLFEKRERNYRIGGNLQPKRDLYRYVRWPEYVQLQRKRRVLLTRLKVPPAINQFRSTLDKAQANSLFRLLGKYRPESSKQKLMRLESEKKDGTSKTKPFLLKYGLQHITHLVEKGQAKLVVIAHDVDPIELVLWLPALCRSMGIPYVIVKGKSRLGILTHKKTTTAVALSEVRKEDLHDLELIVKNAKSQFNDNPETNKWGGGIMGTKSTRLQEEKEKLIAQEAAKKAGL